VQIKRAMVLAAMQVNRHADNREMRHDQGIYHDLPSAGAGQSIRQKIEYGIKNGIQNH
jgi:hypothetical protein